MVGSSGSQSYGWASVTIMADDELSVVVRPLPPFATYTLVLLNVFVHMSQYLSPGLTASCLLVPGLVVRGLALHTLVTSIFLHADPIHLALNMYFLFAFGEGVERELRPLPFLSLYFFAGFSGSLGHTFLAVTLEELFFPGSSWVPALGASGAIFGVMAAYAYLMPRRRPRLGWAVYGEAERHFTAWVFIIAYFLLEVVLSLLPTGIGVAHGAHVAGFLAGYFFAFASRRVRMAIERRRASRESREPPPPSYIG